MNFRGVRSFSTATMFQLLGIRFVASRNPNIRPCCGGGGRFEKLRYEVVNSPVPLKSIHPFRWTETRWHDKLADHDDIESAPLACDLPVRVPFAYHAPLPRCANRSDCAPWPDRNCGRQVLSSAGDAHRRKQNHSGGKE